MCATMKGSSNMNTTMKGMVAKPNLDGAKKNLNSIAKSPKNMAYILSSDRSSLCFV